MYYMDGSVLNGHCINGNWNYFDNNDNWNPQHKKTVDHPTPTESKNKDQRSDKNFLNIGALI